MYRILRGENELTGNLIEIKYGGVRILAEAGISLEKEEEFSAVVQEILSCRYNAVFISHGHLDHIGLIDKISKDIPVYMGTKTLELYKLRNPEADYSNYRVYEHGIPINIGGIRVTPYLCDHSVPDSYMLLFESPNERILYTGDYRSKGRKNFKNLLLSLPESIDVLITEFTNAESPFTYSEKYAEEKMTEIMKSTKGPVFVLCSSTNIDRIVGVYKAAAKSGRELLIDEDQEKVMGIFGEKVPNAQTFDRVKVYYPKGIKDLKNARSMKGKRVTIKSLLKKNDFVMIIKTSSLGYITKMAESGKDLSGAALIYSMWSGYKEQERMKEFLSQTEKLGIKTFTAHASGHADGRTIERLIERVKPKDIKTVHTR